MRPSPDRIGRAAALLLLATLSPALAVCAEPLRVRADPPSLVLGTSQAAAIEIEAASDVPPIVTVNVGRVENLRPAGPGQFAADYLPPGEAHPQVAIVAARSGERWGWTAIPLAGRGVAVARSAPGASIQVTIGDAAFGPVRADAAGEAKVPVVVPAGVAYAYHRDEPLDLKIPRTLHVHVALGRAAASADVEQIVPLRVFAVTVAGTPRAGAPLVVKVERGDLSDIVEIAPGEHVATWRVPPGAPGRAQATAALRDEPGLASVATLEQLAGPPARLALEAERARITAGDAAPLALRVRVTDAAGNAVDVPPIVRASRGEVSDPVAVGPGTWQASLGVPSASGAGRTFVTARAAGLEGRIAIEVVPPLVPGAPRERRFLSIAPKIGVAAARGGIWSPALAAEGGFRPGLLDGRLALAVEAGTFVRDRTDEVAVGAQLLSVHGRVRYVPVIASARLERTVRGRQLAWAAFGGGVTFVSSDVSVGGLSPRSESGLVPGLRAAIGWGIRTGRATPFAEAGIGWHGDPRFEALRGSLTVLTASIGCRYDAY